ncbi:unnamed protein product [Ixodes hexagonus]
MTQRASLVSMRDLVPELSSSESSEDESSMMKHLEGGPQQQPQSCENHMTQNYVTIIPVEYPRSDSSSLSEQEICVYLLTKVCLCVEVNSLPLATSDEIMEIIAQDDAEMNLPSQVTEFFALWMTSPLLGESARPVHSNGLPEGTADSAELIRSSLQTDCILSTAEPTHEPHREIIIKANSKPLKSLQMRMLRVLSRNRPCTQGAFKGKQLALMIHCGPPGALTNTPHAGCSELVLPNCATFWSALSMWALGGQKNHGLLPEYFPADYTPSVDYRSENTVLMGLVWVPRRSAFFQGQVERPVTGIAALMNHYDLPVLVAINREGVHVIDPSQPVVLMSLQYRQMSWDYACPAQPQNPDCLPCLFLQFQQPGQADTSVLQIFSKQAVLMDALISTIVDELKRRPSWNKPDVDPTTLTTRLEDDVQVPLTVKKIRQEQGLSCRLRKLSIAKFSSAGDYLNSKGSLEFKRDSRPR